MAAALFLILAFVIRVGRAHFANPPLLQVTPHFLSLLLFFHLPPLISPTPIPTNAPPPRYIPIPISPLKRRHDALLAQEPRTPLEAALQAALREGVDRELEHKVRSLGGIKWLYAQGYYTQDEFWAIYDRKWYEAIREKYHATHLPSVYDKVNMDLSVLDHKKGWLEWQKWADFTEDALDQNLVKALKMDA